MISLYIGGARSGKSSLAEKEITSLSLPTTYIATATASESMAERIALHRQQRPGDWTTAEVPLALTHCLQQTDKPGSAIIVDCLTLWLTNQLMSDACLEDEIDALCQILPSLQCHLVLVSTEVGQSLIPEDDMSQAFVNASGLMLQKIAAVAHKVSFCQGQLATELKNTAARGCDTGNEQQGGPE